MTQYPHPFVGTPEEKQQIEAGDEEQQRREQREEEVVRELGREIQYVVVVDLADRAPEQFAPADRHFEGHEQHSSRDCNHAASVNPIGA